MTKNIHNERHELEMLTIGPMVPEEHLVRKLEAAIDCSFIYPMVESANKRKFEKKIVRKETRPYESKLQEELNQDRVDHGKKPFPPEKFEKEVKEAETSSSYLYD